MPTKVLKKILDEFKQNDEETLNIVDQGVTNILEIPELSKYFLIALRLSVINFKNLKITKFSFAKATH